MLFKLIILSYIHVLIHSFFYICQHTIVKGTHKPIAQLHLIFVETRPKATTSPAMCTVQAFDSQEEQGQHL